MKIETRHDRERACGWRSPGGKYLIGVGAIHDCGKLPIKLTVCPTCGAGIKPARAWTWIKPRDFVQPHACGIDCSVTCPLFFPPDRAGLLWIGEKFYKTPEAFAKEARAQGISRRLPAIPKGFEVGKTLVLLAHRKAPLERLHDPLSGDLLRLHPQQHRVRGEGGRERR